jgi:predicted alpha/beta hydrolase family esterase
MSTLRKNWSYAPQPFEMASTSVLILPGWQGSGPDHWQMRWAHTHGYAVVAQDDWMRPKRGDWLARLDEVVIDTPGPLVLAAHSLGCIQVAAWAAVSRHTARVVGALLVAPGDVEAETVRELLPGWSPIVRQKLPFASILVGSQNDPYCRADRAQALARDWGAEFVDLGAAGHINAESQLGDWPAGHALLNRLTKET